jgi:surface carbohydrate biosynthesis protein (TIGR04326 family)
MANRFSRMEDFSSKQKILLISAYSIPQKKIKYFNNHSRWFYIGNDFNMFLRWKTHFSTVGTYFSLSTIMEEYGLKLREDFLNYIAEMSAANNSLAWWATSLADKDPSGSDFYFLLCLLVYFNEHIDEFTSDTIIIAENPFFLDAFAELATKQGYRCHRLYHLKKLQIHIKLYFKLLGRAIKFFFLSAYEIWLSRRLGTHFSTDQDEKNKSIIIRTWVKDACFKNDGSFEDIYFGKLIDWLQKSGHPVWIIPENMTLSKSRKTVFKYYKKNKSYHFILPEDFLRFSDLIRCLLIGVKGQTNLKLVSKFKSLDISALLTGESLKYGFHGLRMIRYYFFCKRLKNAGIKPKRVIMTFENKFMEKLFIIGLKSFLPETMTIGYQHCAHYPLLLNFFTCKKEIPYLPLPDLIITSGEGFCRILKEEGYPEEKLIAGPALRFDNLFQKINLRKGFNNQRKSVLVVLPADLKMVHEISLTILSAFQDLESTDVLLKVHPSQHIAISNLLSSLKMPSYFKIVKEPLVFFLNKVDAAIAAGSTTAEFEIIAAGIPLVRLRRELGFTFSPWIEGFDQTTSKEALKEKMYYALNLSIDQKEILIKKGKEILYDYFTPISDTQMSKFFSIPELR